MCGRCHGEGRLDADHGTDVCPGCHGDGQVIRRVLDVVAAHEAAAEGQPLGWAADIRNAIEGDL